MTSPGIIASPLPILPLAPARQLRLLSDEVSVHAPTGTSAVKFGAVYTRPWVVGLLLDLAGYTSDCDLAQVIAVEPAAGSGAFLVEMARRLASSCRQHGRPLTDARSVLLAFDIDPAAVSRARAAVADALTTTPGTDFPPVSPQEAAALAEGWVQAGDYLSIAPTLPLADFVVGNPPYVRLEDVEAAVMARYRREYPAMTGRADLYIAFYEAALLSLKLGGVCAFICADRWMRNQYGAGLRRLVTSGSFHVETVLEMHDAGAFEEDVSAYPAITVIRRNAFRTPNAPTVVARLEGKEVPDNDSLRILLSTLRGDPPTALPVSINSPNTLTPSVARVSPWFVGDEPWPQVSPEKLALLRRLEAQFPTLEDAATGTRVGIGVATGLDRVFLTDDPALVEPECLLPLAFAGDVQMGISTLTWSGRYLVDPWQVKEARDFARFPRLLAYLTAHQADLQARHIARANPSRWFRTIDRVDHTLTGRRKLYLPDIKGRITPVLDEGTTYPHHNLYVITSDEWDLEVLGGLLLSDIAQFFVECYAVRMRGGYLRFQAQYLRRIRIPRQESLSPEQCAELTAAFRSHDIARATAAACEAYGIAEISSENYSSSRKPL